MKTLFLIAVGILLVGCVELENRVTTEEKTVTTYLDNPFQLKVNQTAFIESENLEIKFLTVTGDSRCPSDVNCVWAGSADILVNILKNNENLGDFSLASYATKVDSTIKNFDRYSIKLEKVEPYPETDRQRIKLSDYVVTLVVSGAQ